MTQYGGRDLKHLVNTVRDLSERGIGLRALAGQRAQFDTTTPTGKPDPEPFRF